MSRVAIAHRQPVILAPEGEIPKSLSNVPNPETINPFDLTPTHGLTLSKTKFAALKTNIEQFGILEPINYVEHNGQKFVVNGHHRLMAAKKIGLGQVPVFKVELPHLGYKTVNDLIYEH